MRARSSPAGPVNGRANDSQPAGPGEPGSRVSAGAAFPMRAHTHTLSHSACERLPTKFARARARLAAAVDMRRKCFECRVSCHSADSVDALEPVQPVRVRLRQRLMCDSDVQLLATQHSAGQYCERAFGRELVSAGCVVLLFGFKLIAENQSVLD